MKLRILPLLGLLLAACAGPEPSVDIIPAPLRAELGKGWFKPAGQPVYCDAAMGGVSRAKVGDFAYRLATVGGEPVTVMDDIIDDEGILFLVNPSLAPEAYLIDISTSSLRVEASSDAGFLYALQSLAQLFPPAWFGSKKVALKLPCVRISDAPRFAYRGVHLDPCRHFWTVEETKRYLDIAAMFKVNRLHWHLTDDQGWRIEIKKYPRLTEVGAWRAETCVKKQWDPFVGDGTPHGGWYSQDEIRDIISYAEGLGITIIPEVDLPGHMVAALAAYPELGCTGGPYKVREYWGVSDDLLCVGQEKTFTFLEEVLSEIVELFPSEYIHIGGDECPKGVWKECPRCQARIKALGLKDSEHATAEQYLQNYVTSRIQKFLAGKGRKIIGWDEILEGELAPGATVMSWRGATGGIEAAHKGFDVIMAPNNYCYLDYYQGQERDKEPFGIGGYVPLDLAYSFDPFDQLDEEAKAHILGVQANLWTEYISEFDHLTYMLLPRLCALSEVQWCHEGSLDWTRFNKSLDHTFAILDQMGVMYSATVRGRVGLNRQPARSPKELAAYLDAKDWDW